MPQTLLLADDSVTIQRVIELTFAEEGIRVVAVSDGNQAIERLNTDPPDIVLADVGMPGRNGYEVAQYMKQTPSLAHIPVVLLTGAFEPVDQAKAKAVGCDGVLAKPFEPQLVIGRVKELLARPRPATALRAPVVSHAPVAVPASAVAPAPAAASAVIAEFEEWESPLVDHALPVHASTAPPATNGSDDYFDRLDAAFAGLGTAPQGAPQTALSAAGPDVDWFGGSAAPAADNGLKMAPMGWPEDPVDLPLAPPKPVENVVRPAATPTPVVFEHARPPFASVVHKGPSPATPSAAPSSPSGTAPPMADAFAALLAAEQKQTPPAAMPAWPPQQAELDIDDVVERVTQRVLDRLSDAVVRETVGEIVSKVAERLVQEEIDRIKASAK